MAAHDCDCPHGRPITLPCEECSAGKMPEPRVNRTGPQATTLTTNSDARKEIPIATGVLDYFPAAIAAVAKLSKYGNDKHNPGEPLHWARGKSADESDCLIRHFLERGTIDPTDGIRHSVKVAWRALALLQKELEVEEGAPLPRGARLPPATVFVTGGAGGGAGGSGAGGTK